MVYWLGARDGRLCAREIGREDGRRAYFVGSETALGTMAEKAIVDMRRIVVLPDDADAVKVAAAMNPAMSSWVALRRRVPLEAGQGVLILGVTGNAGRMAVQNREAPGRRSRGRRRARSGPLAAAA